MATLPPSFPPPRLPHPAAPAAPHPLSAERPVETSTGGDAGPVAAATLLVRHLPEAIPLDVLSRLFYHYGASAVRPCAGGRLRNSAFVDFADEALATRAQSQLNRLRFLGKILSVEKASKVNSKNIAPQRESQSAKDSFSSSGSQLKDPINLKTSSFSAEPIAPRLGVDYSFPPHLEYAYPPPDGNILTNILNALIAVPRFYVQVLHLMNKMNIPAPFRAALPTPPLPPPIPAPPPPPLPVSTNMKDVSSDESEMESSEEDTDKSHSRKRVKLEAIVGPAVDKSVQHESVGLKHVALSSKEVPVIKKKNPILQIKINPKQAIKETTDSTSDMKDYSRENLEEKPFATAQEIEEGKLPPEQILSLPMFKNYSPGNPSNVLYIKNLAKDVVVDDFYFIFGSLFDRADDAKSALNIKLMQEGRMRGQAFVTFPSVDLAQHALNLVNGYVFKGKPIITQFGRNPTAGKVN